MIRESLATLQATLPPDSWPTLVTRCELGAARAGQGDYEDGERLLLDGYSKLFAFRGYHDRPTLDALQWVVRLYDAWHIAEPDQGYDLKAAEWRARLGPPPTSNPATAAASGP